MTNLIRQPWDAFTRDTQPHDRISENFVYYELTRSDISDRQGIDNSFRSVKQLRSAVYLCRHVLQPVRDEFGRYSPNSVFRCQDLERALKKKRRPWTSKSQHTKGEACDIEIPGFSNMELARWVADSLEFDQVILECHNPAKGANSGWVHVSLKAPGGRQNRRKLLSYVMDPARRKFVYVDGLTESPET
jgi:hypothetical protein